MLPKPVWLSIGKDDESQEHEVIGAAKKIFELMFGIYRDLYYITNSNLVGHPFWEAIAGLPEGIAGTP